MNLKTSDYPVYNSLITTAATQPDQLAIADEFGILTYRALYEHAESLKTFLFQVGIIPETGLALITGNNRYFIIGLYAGIGSGCVVMPLANYQRPEEIKKALAEARIHFILTDNPEIAALGKQVTTTGLLGQPLYVSETGFSKQEKTVLFISGVAVMRFTSGTTGDAKCVILTHQTILDRIRAANEGLQLSAGDRVIWILPMAYHFVVSIMLYIHYGCGIIISDDFLAENILTKAAEYSGTFLYASPMHIRLLATTKHQVSLPALKRVISTTAGINPAICKAFEEKYGLPVSQAFGIIEAGLPIINLGKSKEHPEAVGYGLPSFAISILDDAFRPLPNGEVGNLAVKGPGMFDGYLSPPTRKEEVLKEGWFITGDLATMSNDGLIEIKGRTKNVINVLGNKVFPNEVEDVINLFEGIIESKVYSQRHALMGEIVAADVIVKPDILFDSESLIQHCRQLLSPFKIPQRIRVVDHIEMTPSGKIRRS
jgi:acyl-CoA synthetase (AMP-forming)/AMP-acid ligase II